MPRPVLPPAVAVAHEAVVPVSATGRDQDYADAMKATCGLSGCAAKPGEPCVNSVDGRGPRDEPHFNRVVRGRRINDGREL